MAIMVNEEPITQSYRAVTPTDKDVLLGKGTPINNHAGNKTFRRLIKLNHMKYDNEAEGNKFLVARAIVDELYSEGCRFLKKSKNGVWQEVEKKRAYGKAQQTLRDGAPKRREKKCRLLREKLQRETPLPQPDFLRVSTPPPQQPIPVTAAVVSPVATPALGLSAAVGLPFPSASAAPEDSTGLSSHHYFPNDCILSPWLQEVDTSVRKEAEQKTITLKPDAVFEHLVGNDQQQQELFFTDELFSFDGITPLFINDSESDEDWFDQDRPLFLA